MQRDADDIIALFVQQRRRDRVGVEADLSHDLRYGKRMDDIRLSGFTFLVTVEIFGKIIRLLYHMQLICRRMIMFNFVYKSPV